MSISPAHSQIVIHALSMAAQVAGQQLGLESNRQQMQFALASFEEERAMFETKAGLMRDLAAALIERRVDAVKSGFSEVLALYAEQARHFMDQQAEFGRQELATVDPLQSIRLRKRMSEIDIELRSIRGAARQLYTQMNEIIMRFGGEALAVSPAFTSALSLPSMRGSA